MQAIVKCKHEQFLNFINELKIGKLITDEELNILEQELEKTYENYVQKIGDLKMTILEYRVREKMLRIRLRELALKKQQVVSI